MSPETKSRYCEGCRLITLAETIHYCEDCIKPLLRVARAGPGMMEIAETAMPGTYFQSDSRVCEMRDAIKELPEHLLD